MLVSRYLTHIQEKPAQEPGSPAQNSAATLQADKRLLATIAQQGILHVIARPLGGDLPD